MLTGCDVYRVQAKSRQAFAFRNVMSSEQWKYWRKKKFHCFCNVYNGIDQYIVTWGLTGEIGEGECVCVCVRRGGVCQITSVTCLSNTWPYSDRRGGGRKHLYGSSFNHLIGFLPPPRKSKENCRKSNVWHVISFLCELSLISRPGHQSD